MMYRGTALGIVRHWTLRAAHIILALKTSTFPEYAHDTFI